MARWGQPAKGAAKAGTGFRWPGRVMRVRLSIMTTPPAESFELFFARSSPGQGGFRPTGRSSGLPDSRLRPRKLQPGNRLLSPYELRQKYCYPGAGVGEGKMIR